MTIKDVRYARTDSVIPLYLIINKTNGYIEKSNENKYLALVSIDESKDTVKNCEELRNEIRDVIKSIINNSENYYEKYIKIKFDLDDNLPLKKTLELYNMVIVVKSVFHEDSKHYP